ncbi:MAG TPA: sigma 54-interacting transcriptional regulator, partial [Syntrophomonas sp.]|nr:sigma 54-interacting transcriptional regulator [Syntrophomonas sp.]
DRIESHKKLKTMSDIMNTTLNLLEYGVVTVDQAGNIVHANNRACEILRMEQHDRKNILDYFHYQNEFWEKLNSGLKKELDDNFTVVIYGVKYVVMANPIINDEDGGMEVAVLSFLDDETINSAVHQRSGAFARFSFEKIIGNSPQITEIINKARRFAASAENILLLGESGTGKELFAQAIHNSYNPKRPFIAVNCAAMPRSLIESELFGYEGGSFTGADRKGRPGKIELANGGTLFLDEIGDMPLELQAVLLRAIQDKRIMRVGGREYFDIDFRLIASTNKDLYRMVQEGQFRDDLYYRLSVLTLRLPPLRERVGDVDLFIDYCMENYCQKIGVPKPKMSGEVRRLLNHYQWPGNVRQLENAIIYCINSAKDGVIGLNDLPWEIGSPNIIVKNPTGPGGQEEPADQEGQETLSMSEIEKKLILKTLAQTNHDIAKCAELLGMGKSTVYRKIKKYQIDLN